MAAALPNVSFTPESGHHRHTPSCPLSAITGRGGSFDLPVFNCVALDAGRYSSTLKLCDECDLFEYQEPRRADCSRESAVSTLAESIPITETTAPADRRRRIVAIVGASSGNLVEWYDFYAYAFTSIYFASAFFPSGNQTSQLLATAGIFAIASFYTSISGVVKAELFPTEVRALGVGLTYAIANALFGGTAEYVALWLKASDQEQVCVVCRGIGRDWACGVTNHA